MAPAKRSRRNPAPSHDDLALTHPEPVAGQTGAHHEVRTLQAAAGNRAVSDAVQRMWGPNAAGKTAEITDLASLNTALAKVNAQGPPPHPLAQGSFPAATSPAHLSEAIASSQMFIASGARTQDVIADVQAELQADRPPAAAEFEHHGHKHFGGRSAVGEPTVKIADAQWSETAEDGQAIMLAEIRRIEAALRQHCQGPGRTTYYHTVNHGSTVGKLSPGKTAAATSNYSIQITYNLADNTLEYHGYPDSTAIPLGLGYSKAVKQWRP